MKTPSIPPFHPHRRTFLQWLNAGLATAPFWSLAGCDDSPFSDPYPALLNSSDWTSSSNLPTFEADSDLPWWLKGNYAPVPEEIEVESLEVIGSLPPELNGFFLRNGPNPLNSPSFWFFGAGMLHVHSWVPMGPTSGIHLPVKGRSYLLAF